MKRKEDIYPDEMNMWSELFGQKYRIKAQIFTFFISLLLLNNINFNELRSSAKYYYYYFSLLLCMTGKEKIKKYYCTKMSSLWMHLCILFLSFICLIAMNIYININILHHLHRISTFDKFFIQPKEESKSSHFLCI